MKIYTCNKFPNIVFVAEDFNHLDELIKQHKRETPWINFHTVLTDYEEWEIESGFIKIKD